jgi:thiol-disulfide isomerase/thioredoxin
LLSANTIAPAGAQDGEPALQGEFADNFTLLDPPVPTPEESIETLDGTPVKLSRYKGEVILLNFWATWCAPCVREMPALERLAIDLKDEGLRVVAASMDVKGAELVKPFLEKLGLSEMTVLLDRRTLLGQAFGIQGLPTTYLIDREGRVVGAYQGPAEWDSEEAKTLIGFYLKSSQSASLQ